MSTAVITHPACLDHETPPGHSERPDRLRAVIAALETEPFAALTWLEAPAANRAQLARVHNGDMIDAVLSAIPDRNGEDRYHPLDSDTWVSAGSGEAALRAAGAVVHAVDLVLAGAFDNAFCAIRPPGHHAEPDMPMGFCLFNNIAVGALHARAHHGVGRIAAIDFDVHHGNGTQTTFSADEDLFFLSSHQWPLYPGTGHPAERGPFGNILNLTLPPGAGSEAFRQGMSEIGVPALRAFAPDLILISAGFDAHWRDPLGGLNLEAADYGWITAELCAVARETCGGRVVSTLEGGYDLSGLASSAAAHVAALLEG